MTYSHDEHRKVLLIDSDIAKQILRANVLRNHEVEVDTASNVDEAQRFWIARAYDLVLMSALENSEEAALLAAKVRATRPHQRLALLVGPPAYLREIGNRGASLSNVVPGQPAVPPTSPSAHGYGPQWHAMMERIMMGPQITANSPTAARGGRQFDS